jgi:hypothetical protein
VPLPGDADPSESLVGPAPADAGATIASTNRMATPHALTAVRPRA